jgi:hypothetical protein
VADFLGNFLLALMLVVLLRVLCTICTMLMRTGDVGNRVFAFALPAGLLYIVISNPVPVTSWAGLASGGLLGAGLWLVSWRLRQR